MKQAVVYVVDVPKCAGAAVLDGTSAWELTQHHVLQHVGSVVNAAASSLVSFVLCGTPRTHNHIVVQENDDDTSVNAHEFAHLTEITYGLVKVQVPILREWLEQVPERHYTNDSADNSNEGDQAVTPAAVTSSFTASPGGSVVDGFRLALESLRQQTAGKQFRRSIWVYTSTASSSRYQLRKTVDELIQELQALSCAVHVVDLESPRDVPVASLEHKEVPHQEVSMGAVEQIASGPPFPSAVASHMSAHSPAAEHNAQTDGDNSNDDDDSVTDDEADYGTPPKRIKQEIEDSGEMTEKVDDPPEKIANPCPITSTSIDWVSRSVLPDEFWRTIVQECNNGVFATAPDLLHPSTYRTVTLLVDLFPGAASLENASLPPEQKDPHYAKTFLCWLPPHTDTAVQSTPEAYGVPVRLSLLHAKQNAPVLKSGVLYFEEPSNGDNPVHEQMPAPERTPEGDVRIGDTRKITRFVQLQGDPAADDDQVVYSRDDTTKVLPYGASWQLVDASFDHSTIPATGVPRGPVIHVIGCVARDEIDEPLQQGPCHVVTGHDSVRACAAVAAWAQALHETDKVAIVWYAKSKNTTSTKLGALLPGNAKWGNGPRPLYLVTLPYQREVRQLPAEDWQEGLQNDHGDDAVQNSVRIASNLIEALWLSDDQAENILQQPDPFITAWNATAWNRAVHPHTRNLVFPRCLDDFDPLGTPLHVREKAQSSVVHFREHFPLVRKIEASKKEQGSKSLTYTNFVEKGVS
jgi:hypothetical protein